MKNTNLIKICLWCGGKKHLEWVNIDEKLIWFYKCDNKMCADNNPS